MSDKTEAPGIGGNSGNTPLKIILIAVGICVVIMIAVLAFGDDKARVAGDPTPLPQRPQINDTVRIGAFDITITDATRADNYVTLHISAQNMANKSDSIYSDAIKLRSGGAVYDAELSGGFINVNPGIEKTDKITFEVPTSVTDITAAIRPDMLDFGGAEYTLFDIGM